MTIDSAGRPLPQVKLDQIGVNSLGSAVLEPVYGYWFPDGVSPVAIAARPKWHRSARRNFESALYDILRKQPSLRAINGWAPTRRSDAQWFVLQWIVPVVISAALAFTHSNWIAVMNTAVPLLGLLCVAVPVAYYVLGTLGAYAGLALLDAPSEEA